MIDGIVNSGAMPALELAIGYAAERQKLIAHNIANLSTPEHVQVDVAPETFQQFLRDMLQKRRERSDSAGGTVGELGAAAGSAEDGPITLGPTGLRLKPIASGGGVAFHDRNNRDLERLMQDLAENTAAYRVAVDLLRSQTEIMKSAIAGRV